MVGEIAGPVMIANDIKLEQTGVLEPQRKMSVAYLKEMSQKVLNAPHKLQQNDLFSDLFLQMNITNLKDDLNQKVLDSSFVKKNVAMVSGPILAYAAQITRGIGFLSDIMAEFNVMP